MNFIKIIVLTNVATTKLIQYGIEKMPENKAFHGPSRCGFLIFCHNRISFPENINWFLIEVMLYGVNTPVLLGVIQYRFMRKVCSEKTEIIWLHGSVGDTHVDYYYDTINECSLCRYWYRDFPFLDGGFREWRESRQQKKGRGKHD